MIAVMQPSATAEDIEHVVEVLRLHNLKAQISQGEERTVIGVIGTGFPDDLLETLEVLPGVDRVTRITRPFKLASRDFRPSDTVVDAGANVGYMTVLASVVAGPGGRVLSFEPHPALFAIAQRNVASVRERLDVARTELHQMALGDRPGTAHLQIPPDFESNDGTARIGEPAVAGNQSLAVQIETLDNVLDGEAVAVLKLDVEGFELQVLHGCCRALADLRVRHIVFEDHKIGESEVVRDLRRTAYHVFSLGWSWRGLRVEPGDGGRVATEYEAPSFIATLEPDEMLARCSPAGWLVLSDRLAGRCSRRAAQF